MTLSYRDVPIYEYETYQDAGVDLLVHSLALLDKRQVKLRVIPQGRGTARLLNLLQWELQAAIEYVDGDGPLADQVIHAAMHHFSDALFGSDTPEEMLFGECIASAVDFYLLGKLIQAGIENDFLFDTIESLESYYEQYSESTHLVKILQDVAEHPFKTFMNISEKLFDWVAPLLHAKTPESVEENLLAAQDSPYWPLIHHYNVGNWVLTLRARFPNSTTQSFDSFKAFKALGENEADFLAVFVNHC